MDDSLDEPLVMRYLFGTLSADEREAVVDRIAADERYFEALCAFEDELIWRYHRSELTNGERKLFEAAYSATPARRRRVAEEREFLDAARAIWAARAESPPAAGGRQDLVRPPLWQRAREWLGRPRTVPNVAVAGATAMLVGAVAWTAYTTVAGSRVAGGVRVLYDLSASADVRDTRGPGGPVAGPEVAAPILRLEADATELQLSIDLVAVESTEGLDVELRQVGGAVVPTNGRWRVIGARLTVTVPVSELRVGDTYTLRVFRRGVDGVDLAAHAFHVSRE